MADITQGVRIQARVVGREQVDLLNKAIDTTISRISALNGAAFGTAGVARMTREMVAATAAANGLSAALGAVEGVVAGGLGMGVAIEKAAALSVAMTDAAAAIELAGGAAGVATPLIDALTVAIVACSEKVVLFSGLLENLAAGIELTGVAAGGTTPLFEAMTAAMAASAAVAADLAAAMNVALSSNLATVGATGSLAAVAASSEAAFINIELVGIAATEATPLLERFIVAEAAVGEASTALAAAAEAVGISIELAAGAAVQATAIFDALAAAAARAAAASAAAASTATTGAVAGTGVAVGGKTVSAAAVKNMAGLGSASTTTSAALDAVAVSSDVASVAFDALAVAARAAAATVTTLASAIGAVAVALQAMATTAGEAATANVAVGQSALGTAPAIIAQVGSIMQLNAQLRAMIATALKMAATPIGASIIAGVSMALLAKSAIQTAAELEKLHQRMGISTEDLSVFKVAAEQVGLGMDEVAMAMRMFDRHVDEAVNGRGKLAIANFKEIGMSMDDLKHKDPKTLFLEFATAITKIEDPTTRSAKATELMGRASERLIPLMNLLAGEGFSKVAAEAQRLGVIISTDQAKAALEFEKSWAKTKLSLEGVGVSILGAVVPALSALADGMTFMNTDPVAKWVNPFHLLAVAVKAVVAGLETIFGWIEKIGARIGLVLGGLGMIFSAGPQAELTDKTKALVAAGKTRSKPGGYSTWQDFSETYGQTTRGLENKWADRVGAAGNGLWGIDMENTPSTDKGSDLFNRGHDKEQIDKAKQTLAVARDQLAVAQAQARVAEAADNLTKLKLEHSVKLLEIQKQLDQHIRAIPATTLGDDRKALIDVYGQTAKAQRVAENATYATALDETKRRMHEQTRELQAQLDIQRMQLGSEGAIADNVKEQINYATKLAQIENERQKSVAGIDPKDPQKKQLTSLYNQTAAAKAIEAELQHQAAVEATARAQEQEQRALTTTANEAERAARIAQVNADLAQQQAAAFQTQAVAEKIANDQRIIAEEEFQGKRVQITEDAQKKIAEQQVIIDHAQGLLNGNSDGVSLSQEAQRELLISIQQAAQKKVQINRAANAQIAADDTAMLTKEQAIAIALNNAKQAAIDNARGDAFAEQMQNEINGLERLGTWEAYQSARAKKAELKQYIDMLDAVRAHWKNLADEMGKAVGTVFDTLLRGGKLSDAMKNIGEGFQKIFEGDLLAIVNRWTTQISNAAQGLDANGHVIPGGITKGQFGPAAPGANGSPEQIAAQRKLNLATIAGAGLSGYAAGQGNGAATTAAATAFVSGAMSGNIYVAVAAAVVSLIGSAISGAQKRADYKFGVPGFLNGKAELSTPENLTAAKVTEMTAQLQKSFNDAWNGFVNIMIKLPGSKLPSLETFNGGHPFQYEASAHWAEHFATYVSDTLPREVAEKFKAGMSAAFTSAMAILVHGPVTDVVKKALGAQFDKFWSEASSLDAAGRLQFWNDLTDGLVAFTNALTKFKSVNDAINAGDLSTIQLDVNGTQHQYGDSDFVTNLKAGTQGIFDQARAMVALTGPDRIAAFKALGQSIEKVSQSLIEYVNHIAEVLRNVQESFHDAFYQHALSRAGQVTDANGNVLHEADKNQMARLMEEEYNRTVDRIQHAKELGLTADEVNNLTNKAIGLLNDIYSLDPTAAADAWWQKQMGILQTISTASLNELGQAARDAVSRLIAEVQPFVDWFNGLPVDLDAAMKLLTGPDGAFKGFADALAALTDAIKASTPKPSDGKDPNDPKDPKDPRDPKDKVNSVSGGTFAASSLSAANGDVYHFSFGNVYGVDDLQGQIKSAIRSVARSSPNSLRRDYT